MLRRSIRLQEAGYYTDEGAPTVSYREILYRIFWRRKAHGHGHQHGNMAAYDEPMADHDELMSPHAAAVLTHQHNTRTDTRTGTFGIISHLLLLFLLGVGITHYIQMHAQLRTVQQEVEFLRHHVHTFVPLADAMPNFALESQGARVVHSLSSDTYWPQGTGMFWSRVFSWWHSCKTRRRVIQGQSSLHPGRCWAFSGDQGHLFISLSHPVSISHVTLGHISKSQSPNGNIASAPRVFSVYGMRSEEEEGTLLRILMYDEDGAAFQTFKLPNADKGIFKYVKLQIIDNWGNRDYTCLYSFRVHGKYKMLTERVGGQLSDYGGEKQRCGCIICLMLRK
ncbi:SUN domain-containing protein 3-like [Plectropomus leopardus]|uniref:SUN domain-containing protein 3-like n=1 Tax=Plectropomus leopardus TaxID=160734 RepID=UPI001C4C9D7D|nr:SUN domain-containing protein 3-like [Plectropomus leopardus]